MRYIRYIRTIFLVAGFSLWLVSAQTSVQNEANSVLTIRGDVPAALMLKADDLARMPREVVSVPDQDGTKVRGRPLAGDLETRRSSIGQGIAWQGSGQLRSGEGPRMGAALLRLRLEHNLSIG